MQVVYAIIPLIQSISISFVTSQIHYKGLLKNMNQSILRIGMVVLVSFLNASYPQAEETYFFWYGSSPLSVSWAPFDWEGQGRSSGFADSVLVGEFFNHTPDAGTDEELNTSLTFSFADAAVDQGAHHPTVLPGGIGTVSLWVYYDLDNRLVAAGNSNSIYLSVQPGNSLVNGNYIGVVMTDGESNFHIVSKSNPTGTDGPAMNANAWNHIVFTDDGQSTHIQINDTDAGLRLASGGNLWYINIVTGEVQPDGSIENGDANETWYIDDIVCTSVVESGYFDIHVPLTSNTVTIDGVINPDEVRGANPVIWDGSTTERPGVHAQFYGQWQLPTSEDMTATAYLQHNGTNLYICIDVVDDVIELRDGGSWWEEDSTEIYIDHDNSRSTSGAAQISVRADNQVGNADDYSAWLFSESKVKPDNDGWQIELEVDMAARGLQQGQSYGFDVSINDSDGENEPGYQGAQEWLYASFEAAYYNETYWGNIRLLSTENPVTDWQLF